MRRTGTEKCPESASGRHDWTVRSAENGDDAKHFLCSLCGEEAYEEQPDRDTSADGHTRGFGE